MIYSLSEVRNKSSAFLQQPLIFIINPNQALIIFLGLQKKLSISLILITYSEITHKVMKQNN
ncbi:hypothetical protein C6H66_20745 [Photorhabdus hindustanensis]|uniref:Uncharacterized protein n=1 Tax=Photorhabdus hindustanensis TaxID=2918802 RepID=A0A2S8PW07_9GAMM|nr:hypothetical protein C6H66_20745 [Photorhabdus hindustanensis]